jgi:hypothetical protein
MQSCATTIANRLVTDPCDDCFHTLAVHKVGRKRPVVQVGALTVVDDELTVACSVCEVLDDVRDQLIQEAAACR